MILYYEDPNTKQRCGVLAANVIAVLPAEGGKLPYDTDEDDVPLFEGTRSCIHTAHSVCEAAELCWELTSRLEALGHKLLPVQLLQPNQYGGVRRTRIDAAWSVNDEIGGQVRTCLSMEHMAEFVIDESPEHFLRRWHTALTDG